MTERNHAVHTILAATFLNADYSNLVFRTNIGMKIEAPSYVFCITGEHDPILVDTSFRLEACEVYQPQWRGDPHDGIVDGLAAIGLKPADIGTVVLTHLHYDHCGQTHLFPQARLTLQRRELAHAAAPYYNLYYYRPDIARFVSDFYERLWLLDGDEEVVPGVKCFFTGGHSAGHQGVFVETAAGRVTIGGDIIARYDNLHTRTPNLINVIEVVQATERIRRESDIVLASHDPQVLDRYRRVG